MIRLPTKTEVKDLQKFRSPYCLTIYAAYLPPHAPGDNPNRIELKNLLKTAKRYLANRGLDQTQIEELIKPVDRIFDEDEFRPNYRHGEVLFVAPDFIRFYNMPTSVRSDITIDVKFDLKQVEKVMEHNLPYYLLLLNHKDVQFFRGDNYLLEEVELTEFPHELTSSLRIDENPQSDQYHQTGPVVLGHKADQYHGHYNIKEVDKERLTEFFRLVNKAVNQKIKKKNIPLILAGVDYLLPLYRRVNTYPHLEKEQISGNLERTPNYQIRKKAVKVLSKRQK